VILELDGHIWGNVFLSFINKLGRVDMEISDFIQSYINYGVIIIRQI